jgi:hypothetical protein
MNLELLTYKLLEELKDIELQSENIQDQSYRSIEVCRNLLSKFKKEILVNDFESIEAEIVFFKKTKQVPLVHLIYFSEIHSFEIQFPRANKDCQLKFIKKKINKLNRFFLYNLDFGQYINSGDTRFDREYYTRDCLSAYHITTSKFYFQDPDFCTSRDMLLGKYQAFNSLVLYLEDRIFKLENNLNGKKMIRKQEDKLHWPFSNTDYVELLYALCAAGISKQNNLSIGQVSKVFQEIFDLQPKDIYKTFQDIKSRKSSRTSFLDKLTSILLSEMNKSEE